MTDTLEVHIIELPKLIKQLENNKGNKKDKLILWLMFLLNPENVGDEDMKENEDIKKALEELEKIKESEQDRRLAELRMKHILDQNSIRKSGFREGEKHKQLEIAKKLIEIEMPIEQVIQITELTEEEIKNIK